MLLFVLLNVVHQLIVGKDVIVVVIIDRANKLYDLNLLLPTAYSAKTVTKNSTMASGTRGSGIPCFSTTGRVTSLQHVLKIVLECDLTSHLYLSVLQHFGGDEDKFNIIDYFLCNQTYFENLSYSETVIENPNEKDPTKVVTRVER
jgi:hypothetical protein